VQSDAPAGALRPLNKKRDNGFPLQGAFREPGPVPLMRTDGPGEQVGKRERGEMNSFLMKNLSKICLTRKDLFE